MTAVRNGDLAQLGLLFERHHLALIDFLARMTGDRAAAEDLVQDVFIRILNIAAAIATMDGSRHAKREAPPGSCGGSRRATATPTANAVRSSYRAAPADDLERSFRRSWERCSRKPTNARTVYATCTTPEFGAILTCCEKPRNWRRFLPNRSRRRGTTRNGRSDCRSLERATRAHNCTSVRRIHRA